MGRRPFSCAFGRVARTYRHEEHGEEVDHGLHVELALGSDADGGEEGQAAEGGQEQFRCERPHGPGRKALAGEEGRTQASRVPRAEKNRDKACSLQWGSDSSCGSNALKGGGARSAYVEGTWTGSNS